jgi:cysteine desulfurase/selenocysteine lyase
MNPYDLRKWVLGTEMKVPLINGKQVIGINFDNGATTPPFISVMNTINRFSPWYSSVHRGTGYKSRFSSWIYERAREIICDFVGADIKRDIVIFTNNTTQSINKAARRLREKEGDGIVLSTHMEHHSNDLPWRSQFDVDYIGIDEYGRLDFKDLESKLKKYNGKVKLITMTGASNVTGYINPIHKAARIAHKYGAKVFVDGAQLVPHVSVDMKEHGDPEHIDFLAFSAHKMYAPFGVGVLIGEKDFFIGETPSDAGGGTVKFVTSDDIVWNDPPHNEEAGSPNVIGVVALIEAIQTLRKIGMNTIEEYEKRLMSYAINKLNKISDIKIYGDSHNIIDRLGIVSFNIKDVPHQVTALALSYEGGIAVRNGCFCAQPYIQRLLKLSKEEIINYIEDESKVRPGMVRLSLGLYNNFEEIERLVVVLRKIVRNKKYYIYRYEDLDRWL